MATLQPHSVVITSFKLFCISANLLKEAGASELLWCSNSYMAIFYWFQPKSKWVSDCLLSQIQGKPALPTSPANLSLTLTLVQINTQWSELLTVQQCFQCDQCPQTAANSKVLYRHHLMLIQSKWRKTFGFSPTINSDVHSELYTKNTQTKT